MAGLASMHAMRNTGSTTGGRPDPNSRGGADSDTEQALLQRAPSDSSSLLTPASSIPDLTGFEARRRGGSTLSGPPRRDSFGSFRSLSSRDRQATRFPTNAEDYQLIAELGLGVTATVYLAICKPLAKKVAVKLLNLEAIEKAGGLDVVIKETAVMAGMRHSNVLSLLAAFVEGSRLWMVLPFYSCGSLLSIVQYRHPEGFQDWPALATVMREVARGLAYMHGSGRIHRDLKAANILVAPDGRVALADFGVSAALEASADHDGASQSQHQPGVKPAVAFNPGAALQRVSIQREALQKERLQQEHQQAQGVERPGKAGKMTAAEYRAARRAGQLTPTAPPSLLTQGLSKQVSNASRAQPGSPLSVLASSSTAGEGSVSGAGEGSGRGTQRRPSFSNAAAAKQYLGRSTFVGTPCWMAPEVMAPQVEGYGQAADIWSFGITLLEVATGKAPTARRSVNEILISVLSSPDDPTSIAGELSHTPEAFQEVVYSCLAKNPAERPTAQQLLQMRFFKIANEPATLGKTLLDGVPAVTFREEGSVAPTQAADSKADGRSRSASRTNLSQAGMTQHGKAGVSVAETLETAVALLRQLARGSLSGAASRYALTADALKAGRGFGFVVIKRSGYLRGAARGRGFVVAKLPPVGGKTCWSAPSWYHSRSTASGFTCGNDEVACIFCVRSDEDFEAFTSDFLAPVRSDEGHKNRHLRSCRSLASGNLTQLSINKGGAVAADREANEQVYGAEAEPSEILGGKVRPPPQFSILYEELAAVLSGEPLEAPAELDTVEGARSVAQDLEQRISGASFKSRPQRRVTTPYSVLARQVPAADRACADTRRQQRASFDGVLQPGVLRGAASASSLAGLDPGSSISGGESSVERPVRPRAATLQEADLAPALEALGLGDRHSRLRSTGQAAEPVSGESSPEQLPLQRPSLGRISLSTSAPDLAKLSGDANRQQEGAEADDALPVFATTDDIEPQHMGLSQRLPPQLLRLRPPDDVDDTAMDPGHSPWSRDSMPEDRMAFGQAPAAADQNPAAAAANTGTSASSSSSPGKADGRPPSSDGASPVKQPASLPNIRTEVFPPPLSPGGSVTGGGTRRTPTSLEPVLEDATLIATLPRQPSSHGTPDASIFDIGAFASPSPAEAERQEALLAASDDSPPDTFVSPAGTTAQSQQQHAQQQQATVPENPSAERSPKLKILPPNPTSASAQPRQHGDTPKAADLLEDEFAWDFEGQGGFEDSRSRSLRRLPSAICLPPKAALADVDLSDLAEGMLDDASARAKARKSNAKKVAEFLAGQGTTLGYASGNPPPFF